MMKLMQRLMVVVGLSAALAQPALAQGAGTPDAQTLADIRIELETLTRDLQSLRNELVAGDPALTGVANPAPVLTRVDQIEEELRRLTGQTEQLRFRIDQIVADGTNRIGDLEFRLLELEGGDYSTLGETPPLGEGRPTPAPAAPTPVVAQPPSGDTRPVLRPEGLNATPLVSAGVEATPLSSAPLASEPATGLGLQTNPTPRPAPAPAPATAPAATGTLPASEMFAQALNTFTSGDYSGAERAFTTYLDTYPAAARVGEATFWRGEALAAQNNWNAAARNYLDSFSGAPAGPKAADALYRLGVALGRLGQTEEACLTLGQVGARFSALPADLAARTASEQRALGCQ